MAPPDRAEWNRRYTGSTDATPEPCDALALYADRLPEPGRALDAACGQGGNALWLAKRGWCVDAVDVSDMAIAGLGRLASDLSVDAVVADLSVWAFPESGYDLIVVSRFLDRSLCPKLAVALRPGGLLVYQTFTGPFDGTGPRRAEFRLESGELRILFPALVIVDVIDEATSYGFPGQAALLAQAHRAGN